MNFLRYCALKHQSRVKRVMSLGQIKLQKFIHYRELREVCAAAERRDHKTMYQEMLDARRNCKIHKGMVKHYHDAQRKAYSFDFLFLITSPSQLLALCSKTGDLAAKKPPVTAYTCFWLVRGSLNGIESHKEIINGPLRRYQNQVHGKRILDHGRLYEHIFRLHILIQSIVKVQL